MRPDVSMLCFINSFQKCTLANALTAVAGIRNPKSCHTDFFQEIGTVRITGRTELAVGS